MVNHQWRICSGIRCGMKYESMLLWYKNCDVWVTMFPLWTFLLLLLLSIYICIEIPMQVYYWCYAYMGIMLCRSNIDNCVLKRMYFLAITSNRPLIIEWKTIYRRNCGEFGFFPKASQIGRLVPPSLYSTLSMCGHICWNGFIVADVFPLICVASCCARRCVVAAAVAAYFGSVFACERVFFSFSVFLIHCLVFLFLSYIVFNWCVMP